MFIATVNVNVEPRDGKHYLTINDMSFSSDLSDLHMNFEYEDIPLFLSSMVNRVVNANWRIFKPIIEPSAAIFGKGVLKSTFTPIFERFAMQDFFNMN